MVSIWPIRIKRTIQPHEVNERLISLNCVDQCLLALDSIGECQRHHWVLDVEGAIDLESLENALLSVLKIYPSMRSKLLMSNWRIRRKHEDINQSGIVNLLDLNEHQKNYILKDTDLEILCDKAVAEWIKKPFLLTEELPFRVLLLKIRQTEYKIVFTFPHSLIDGIRTVNFLQRVFEAYNGSTLVEPFTFAFSRQRKGDELLDFARTKRLEVKQFYRKIFFSLLHRFFVEPMHPPSRIFHDKSDNSSDIDYCVGIVDGDQISNIRKTANVNNVKVNDILLASCFTTIDIWNNMHGKRQKKIRVMVPVDLGDPDCKDLISNQVGFLSLSLMPKDRTDPEKILRKVSTIMSAMLRDGIAFSIVYFCYPSRFLPWPVTRAIAKLLMATRIYIDTVVLTNLRGIGPNEDTGFNLNSSKISNINIVGPVVTPMGLTVVIYTYANKLYISSTYKTSLFSKNTIRKFLDTYIAELKAYISNYEHGARAWSTEKFESVHKDI